MWTMWFENEKRFWFFYAIKIIGRTIVFKKECVRDEEAPSCFGLVEGLLYNIVNEWQNISNITLGISKVFYLKDEFNNSVISLDQLLNLDNIFHRYYFQCILCYETLSWLVKNEFFEDQNLTQVELHIKYLAVIAQKKEIKKFLGVLWMYLRMRLC